MGEVLLSLQVNIPCSRALNNALRTARETIQPVARAAVTWYVSTQTSCHSVVLGARNGSQLIPKRTVHDKFPKAPDITPSFRTAYLEVITVGVRDLKPYGFQVRNGCASDKQGLLDFQGNRECQLQCYHPTQISK